MQITRGTDYAIRGVLGLARREKKDWVMSSEIAEQDNLPLGFLAKLFRMLALSDVLKSTRGARGGFMLSRPADQITVWDIIEAIEGKNKISPCLSDYHECDNQTTCPTREVMARAQTALEDIFKGTSIADLLAKEGKRGARK